VVCEDPRKFEALLKDSCGPHGEYRREVFVLIVALKERVVSDLLSSEDKIPKELLLGRLIKRLQDNSAIDERASQWAVMSWALALGKVSKQELNELKLSAQQPRTNTAPSPSVKVSASTSPPVAVVEQPKPQPPPDIPPAVRIQSAVQVVPP